jgi:hypothetical protein
MRTLTLVPAYGRDYKNQKQVAADFRSGKDFLIADFFCKWDGKPCNKQDLRGQYEQVHIRYSRLMKLTVIQL